MNVLPNRGIHNSGVCEIDIQHAFLTLFLLPKLYFFPFFVILDQDSARHYIAEFYLSNSSHGRYLIDVQVDQH